MVRVLNKYIFSAALGLALLTSAGGVIAQNDAPGQATQLFYSADHAELYAAYLLCVEASGAKACITEKPDLSILVIEGVTFPKDADMLQIELQRTLMRGGLYIKDNGEVAAIIDGKTVEAVRIDRGEIVIIEGVEIPKTVNPEVIILDPTKKNLGINQ